MELAQQIVKHVIQMEQYAQLVIRVLGFQVQVHHVRYANHIANSVQPVQPSALNVILFYMGRIMVIVYLAQ